MNLSPLFQYLQERFNYPVRFVGTLTFVGMMVSIRAIPFEILRGAEWEILWTPHHIFLFFRRPPPTYFLPPPPHIL